jgi:hypothetical protein
MSGGVSDADGHPIDGVVAVSAVPKRMRRQIPEAKLIAVLRDPVQRCFSHYQMLAMRGIETRPFDVLVRELLAPEALRQAREAPVETSGYVVRGEYGRILAPYFDEFPRESIHTVFSDELAAHPSRTVAEIFSFLGVDAGFVPPNIGQRYRVGRDRPRHPVVNAGAVQKAFANNTSIRRMWQRLPADTQHRVQYHAARLSYGIDLWNRSAAPATSAPLPDVHDELRALYANDRSKLVSLIRREIPW